jgi:outer membrane lipoprotein-sorting protein
MTRSPISIITAADTHGRKTTIKSLLVAFLLIAFLPCSILSQPNLTAREILKQSEDKLRGETSIAELSIDIIRPTWTRTMKVKAWTKGSRYSMILIMAPVKDAGNAFLKRDKEVWNWVPSIERIIKLPPSMMTQSWMGTDFTNDDLVHESSVLNDYTHTLAGDSTILNRSCWKIEMIPLPQTAVVWGKVYLWIDQRDFMQLRAEFMDEENQLVNTMQCADIRTLGGRLLPATMEMIPADKPGQKTVLRYGALQFNQPIDDNFFTTENMKKVR